MPGIKIVVMVNKVGLLEQTYKRIGKAIGVKDIGTYCGTHGKYETHRPITVSTIQSIHSMPMEKLNLLILDEVHNVSNESGRYFNFIQKNKELNPKLKVVAFTATPYRANGLIYGEGKLFRSITFQKHLKEMIAKGHLVEPHMKRVDHQFNTNHLSVRMGEYDSDQVEKLTSDQNKVSLQIKDALSRMDGRKKIVWACSSIKHCELVCSLLISMGELAVALHSKLEDRATALDLFESGWARHMVFVSIVSEGYDHPPIDCIVLMRPTRSPVLYVQTVGRGLRPSPGKDYLLVLDYGKVVESCGPLDNPRMIEGNRSKKTVDESRDMKFCPSCLEYVEMTSKRCPVCDYEFPKRDLPELDLQASEHAVLLSRPILPQSYRVRDVNLEKYISKNGNECLKIVYKTHNVLSWPIPEFFVWGNDWAQRKMQARLVELGVELKPTLEEQAKELVTRKPEEIIVLEEKFPKIVRLRFDGTSASEPDIRLA